ncbi:MAG TPA: signal peptidase II, partial [Stellaceae bacterium]|nr:signal peptidase II [Stellaceae bacterium]
MRGTQRQWALGLAMAVLVLVLDQLAKSWILAQLGEPWGARRIAPFLNFALTWNRGMSFGLFNGDGALNTLIFTIVAALIIAVLLIWLARAGNLLLALAIGLVVGGAVGNVIDRLF